MKIVAAAIKHGDLIVTMPAPARHADIIHRVHKVDIAMAVDCRQGFLTDAGQFVDRIRAKEIVVTTRQLTIRDTHRFELFSEDLW
jgi:hypothetical protein